VILAKVTGTIVATQKNENLKPYKILVIQPIDLNGNFIGRDMLALDMVDAGIGDTVIALQEGTLARQILGRDDVPVHTLVIAVVDGIEIKEDGNEG